VINTQGFVEKFFSKKEVFSSCAFLWQKIPCSTINAIDNHQSKGKKVRMVKIQIPIIVNNVTIKRTVRIRILTVEKKGSECAICQEAFGVGEDALELPCTHMFHKACINGWVQQKDTCPSCRYELSSIEYETNKF
jgi:hypothetical protein